MNVLKRFFKYVAIDTTSDSTKDKNPTSKGQIKLAEFIVGELKNMRTEGIISTQGRQIRLHRQASHSEY